MALTEMTRDEAVRYIERVLKDVRNVVDGNYDDIRYYPGSWGDFRYLQGYAEATVRAFVLLLTDEEYRRYISEARYPSKDFRLSEPFSDGLFSYETNERKQHEKNS